MPSSRSFPALVRPSVRGRALRPASALLFAAALAACTAGPDFRRPSMDLPAAFKEAPPAFAQPGPGEGWKAAEPQAADSRAPWWQAYGDATLDALVNDALQANQDLRQAEAQYRQAEAVAAEARAAFWPTVDAGAGASRARTNSNGVKTVNSRSVSLSASWEPDLWGGVRRSVEAGDANAEASADDLAAVRLSIETTLAQDYLQLRIVDRQRALYAATLEAYRRSLALTRSQFGAGVALRSDVALAESQLKTTEAEATDLEAQRAQLEHAVAILTGRAPAQLDLPPATAQQPFEVHLPVVPAGLPSELLERRPDIAAAERRAAVANAQIGVAQAAYFPSLLLSAGGGFSGAALGSLFDTPGRVWSLGASLAQTLFDGGARHARSDQALAAYDASVAAYKSTVLQGLQQVEDGLATLRVLQNEAALQDQAVRASQLAERLALAQYRAGTATYLGVVTAQTLALSNERTAVQLLGRQLAASVSLVAATGGGWQAGESQRLARNAPDGASR